MFFKSKKTKATKPSVQHHEYEEYKDIRNLLCFLEATSDIKASNYATTKMYSYFKESEVFMKLPVMLNLETRTVSNPSTKKVLFEICDGYKIYKIDDRRIEIRDALNVYSFSLIVDDYTHVNSITSMVDFVKHMPPEEREKIFEKLFYEHVLEDVTALLEDKEEDYSDVIAYKYVYQKEYSPSLSYWDNLNNLINQFYN